MFTKDHNSFQYDVLILCTLYYLMYFNEKFLIYFALWGTKISNIFFIVKLMSQNKIE